MFEEIKDIDYEKINLDVATRNLLHMKIMKLMIPSLDNKDDVLKWMNDNGGRVSAIIDNKMNGDIRSQILTANEKRDEKNKLTDIGNEMFDDIAVLIKDILEKEPKGLEMQKAA